MKKYLCNAKANKPFRCLLDPIKANVPGCDITYLDNETHGKEIREAWEKLVSLMPDWMRKKGNLLLLGDQELWIHQARGCEVHIKKDRCTNCGDCCLETPDGHTPFGSDDEMKCNALYGVDD